MKRHIIHIVLLILLAFAPVIATHAQPPTGPDGEDASPLEAPIGGGLILLLVMAGAYGAKKVYDARKKLSE